MAYFEGVTDNQETFSKSGLSPRLRPTFDIALQTPSIFSEQYQLYNQ